MPKIGRFPPFGKRFFRRARKIVGNPHFSHFWRVVVALAAAHGRRSLRKTERATRNHRTRQSIAYFLTKAQWDAPALLRQTAQDTLKNLGWKPGDPLYMALDDTQKAKRAKRMDAVSKIFLHAEKVYAAGHTILGCALIYRGTVIPYAVHLYVPKAFAEKTQKRSYEGERLEFHKLTTLAGQMIRDSGLTNVTVLFDSYYLCPAVVKACQDQKFDYVGVAKKNRNFFPDGRDRDKRKVGTYGRNMLDRNGVWKKAGGKKHRLAERVGRLSKLGRVKLVFSRRPKEKSWICLATNQTRWGAVRVLSHYLNRWPIEVLFKESKQYLGLGDYQFLRYRGIERYLHLVLIARLLLTHLAANQPDAQANTDTSQLLQLPSVPELQNLLRSKLWDDAIDSMAKGSRNRRVGKKLKEIIMFDT